MNNDEQKENAPDNSVESEKQQAPAPVPAKDGDLEITAYDVRQKLKGCLMYDAVITKTAKNAFMAQGRSESGSKLTTLMNEEKAMKCIAAGIAKQGW